MATVPSFRTWNVGEIVTAAFLNTNVRDAGNFFVAPPIVEVFQAVAQSLGNAAFTALTFDSSSVDTDGGHSNVTNNSRYVGKTAGYFLFSGGANFAGNATGGRGTLWAKNGTAINQSQLMMFAGTAAVTLGIVARPKIIQLNGTTDYVELQAFQSSGGALNTSVAGQDGATLVGKWIHS